MTGYNLDEVLSICSTYVGRKISRLSFSSSNRLPQHPVAHLAPHLLINIQLVCSSCISPQLQEVRILVGHCPLFPFGWCLRTN